MKDHGIIIEKPETKPYKTQASVFPKRVMLALSSYSHSDKMIGTALENAKYNNRLVIVYTKYDLGSGWNGEICSQIRGLEPQSALPLGANILVYALSH